MFTQVCQFGDASWFTFAWPLGESALKPRGAGTRGAPVVLDPAPGEAWRRLREPGLSTPERDRRAILAMAGPYRVSFDVQEEHNLKLAPDNSDKARAFIDGTLRDSYLARPRN